MVDKPVYGEFKFRGQLVLPLASTPPASPIDGSAYIDSDDGLVYTYTAGSWHAVGGTYIQTITSGTTVVITHGLNTLDVAVSVYRLSDGVEVDVPFTHTSVNTITLNSVVDLAGHRVVVFSSGGSSAPVPTGLPTGGTTGQVLSKASATSYDTAWLTPTQQSNVMSGYWAGFWPYVPTSTIAIAGDQARLARVYLNQAASDVSLEVTTAGSTTFSISVYADTSTGPGSLVSSSSSMSASTTGIRTATLAIGVGWWWIGIHNLSSTAATFRGLSGTNPYSLGMTAAVPTIGVSQAWTYTITGSPPSTLPTVTSQNAVWGVVHYKAA